MTEQFQRNYVIKNELFSLQIFQEACSQRLEFLASSTIKNGRKPKVAVYNADGDL